MGDFVRGGQLSLHAIRMMQQVIKPVIICSLVIWIMITVSLTAKRLNYMHFGAVVAYIEAQSWNMALLEDIDVKFPTEYGVVTRKSGEVPTILFINENVTHALRVLKTSSIISLVITLVLSIFASTWFTRKGKEKIDTDRLRGSEISDYKTIKQEILKANGKHSYDAYRVAGIQYPYLSETKHTLVVGTTGVGKTLLISDIVEQIRERGDKAIIYDTKGSFIEWFYDKDKDFILNPFDRRSEKWNLLKETGHSGHIKSIAESFIPSGKGNSVIWNEAARVAFSGIVEKLLLEKGNITNREIADLLMRQSMKEVAALAKGTYAQSVLDTSAPETAAGVIFTMSTYLNSLRLTNGTKENSFSIKEWVKNEKADSFLYISSNKECESEVIPLQTAWFEIAFKGLLSRERNPLKKIWVILDELGSLQHIPSLQESLTKTREYGCCFILGIQNIAQIESVYGKDSQTISSSCNTRCIFKTPDPETASWMSKNIGDQELEQVKEGLSYGAHQMRDGVNVNKHNIVRPLVMPSEIQNLKELELYLKLPNYDFVKTKLKWKERRVISEAFIENEELIKDMGAMVKSAPIIAVSSNKKIEKDTDHQVSKETSANSKERAEISI